MKFAIVLLGLIALTTAVPQERGILDTVEQLVQNAINSAHQELNNLVSLISGFASNAQSKAQSILAGALSQVAALIDSAENTIATTIAKGGAMALCANKQLGDLENFKNQIGKNVESCATNMSSSIASFEASIYPEIDSLKSTITQLTQLISECTSNILGAVLCATTKLGTVEQLITGIVSDAKTALASAEANAAAAANQVQVCAQGTIGEAITQVNKIITIVHDC